MCMPKKSMIGAAACVCSSSRTSSTAAVVKTSGVTGPSMAASSCATTSRACSTRGDERDQRRVKLTVGNWRSSTLPIVSALMPVLSDRKKTGVGRGEDAGVVVEATRGTVAHRDTRLVLRTPPM